MTLEPLHELAVATAQEAAEFARNGRPPGRVDVAATKSSPIDVVTRLDRETEDLIRRRILGARPRDGFVGEEGADVLGDTDVEWVVDPIDGTVNFVYGLERSAVAVGARVGGKMAVSAVVDIASGRTASTILDEGSWSHDTDASGHEVLNRMSGPPPTDMATALVATGFNYVREVREKQARAVAVMLPHVRDIRRMGAAALDLVDLAAGRLDAYIEQGLKPWDLEPAGLIAQEAGAVLTGLDGPADERLVIAAHPAKVEEYLALARHCGF